MRRFSNKTFKKFLFSKESNYLLNNLTLEIKDNEICSSLKLRNAYNFDKIKWIWGISYICALLVHVINYILGTGAAFMVLIAVG